LALCWISEAGPFVVAGPGGALVALALGLLGPAAQLPEQLASRAEVHAPAELDGREGDVGDADLPPRARRLEGLDPVEEAGRRHDQHGEREHLARPAAGGQRYGRQDRGAAGAAGDDGEGVDRDGHRHRVRAAEEDEHEAQQAHSEVQ